jgi:protein O-mannosyl-transferase
MKRITGHPQSFWRKEWFCPALVGLAVLAAYLNSIPGGLVFDDRSAIVENPTIRALWPISRVISSMHGDFTVSGRPLFNLSLAVNYAMGGTAAPGYHVVNVLIHLLAALTLFGIVRRTFRQPRLRGRFGAASLPLATAAAVLWAVHPLQTESVTYIAQRTESLMGLFYLLTIYCVIRSAEPRTALWQGLAVTACLCGMASKEVMVTAPLMALLYDRTFMAGTFGAALRKRGRLYAGLGGTWLLLGWLVATGGNLASGSAGFESAIDWRSYGLTQFWAVAHYLWLSVWPHPLVLDYGGAVLIGSAARALPYAVLITFLLAGTAISVRRWPAIGFAGCWFFGILALTSSVFPLRDTVFEHRMYLPLAAVVVLAVAAIHTLAGRWREVAFVLLAMACLVLTVRRNEDYRSDLTLWSDTVAKRPDNARAHYDLGRALSGAGRLDDAMVQFQAALRLQPNHFKAQNDLAGVLARLGRTDEAILHYHQAIELQPDFMTARDSLCAVLIQTGRLNEALQEANAALRIATNSAGTFNNLGNIYFRQQRLEEALTNYRRAIGIKPDDAEARSNLGVVLAMQGETDEAIREFTEALRLDPNAADTHNNLGIALEQNGLPAEAAVQYRAVVRLTPNNPSAQFNLGRVLAESGRTDEARTHLNEALRLKPDFPEAGKLLEQMKTQPGASHL